MSGNYPGTGLIKGFTRSASISGGVIIRKQSTAPGDALFLTQENHGLAAGDKVRSVKKSHLLGSGVSGFTFGVDYWVRKTGIATRQFRLSTTSATDDSTPVTLTGGSGTIVRAHIVPELIEAKEANMLASYDYFADESMTRVNNDWPYNTFTATGATFTTSVAHTLVAGAKFVMVSKTGGSNVRLGRTYYVVAPVAATTFSIALTAGGAAITLDDDITAGYWFALSDGAGGTYRSIVNYVVQTIGHPFNAVFHPRGLGFWVRLGGGSYAGLTCTTGADATTKFRQQLLEGIYDRAATPMITLEPTNGSTQVSWDNITAGTYNTQLGHLATVCESFLDDHTNAKVIVRFAQEFNRGWFPWASQDGDGKTYASQTGNTIEKFKDAWRYVFGNSTVDGRLRSAALASNRARLLSHWCPTGADGIAGVPLHNYYSGLADYVDFTGFDKYEEFGEKTNYIVSSNSTTKRMTANKPLKAKDKKTGNVGARPGWGFGEAVRILGTSGGITSGDVYFISWVGPDWMQFRVATSRKRAVDAKDARVGAAATDFDVNPGTLAGVYMYSDADMVELFRYWLNLINGFAPGKPMIIGETGFRGVVPAGWDTTTPTPDADDPLMGETLYLELGVDEQAEATDNLCGATVSAEARKHQRVRWFDDLWRLADLFKGQTEGGVVKPDVVGFQYFDVDSSVLEPIGGHPDWRMAAGSDDGTTKGIMARYACTAGVARSRSYTET